MIYRPLTFSNLTVDATTAQSLQNFPMRVVDDLLGAIITVDASAQSALSVRFRADGTDPTSGVGVVISSNDPPLIFERAGDLLRAMRIIGTTAAVIVNVQYIASD